MKVDELTKLQQQNAALLAALTGILYEEKGRWYIGINGDADVTKVVGAAIAKAQGNAAEQAQSSEHSAAASAVALDAPVWTPLEQELPQPDAIVWVLRQHINGAKSVYLGKRRGEHPLTRDPDASRNDWWTGIVPSGRSWSDTTTLAWAHFTPPFVPDDDTPTTRTASTLSSSAEQASAVPAYPKMTLNGYQLKEALEFIAPDGDAEQMEMEVTIVDLPADKAPLDDDNKRMDAGLYAFITDYPEEGCIPLSDEPTLSTPPAEQQGKVDGWISVADTKPGDWQDVLIALDTGAVVIGMRGPAGWHWADTGNDADQEATATYWMPFPAAPAQEASNG